MKKQLTGRCKKALDLSKMLTESFLPLNKVFALLSIFYFFGFQSLGYCEEPSTSTPPQQTQAAQKAESSSNNILNKIKEDLKKKLGREPTEQEIKDKLMEMAGTTPSSDGDSDNGENQKPTNIPPEYQLTEEQVQNLITMGGRLARDPTAPLSDIARQTDIQSSGGVDPNIPLNEAGYQEGAFDGEGKPVQDGSQMTPQSPPKDDSKVSWFDGAVNWMNKYTGKLDENGTPIRTDAEIQADAAAAKEMPKGDPRLWKRFKEERKEATPSPGITGAIKDEAATVVGAAKQLATTVEESRPMQALADNIDQYNARFPDRDSSTAFTPPIDEEPPVALPSSSTEEPLDGVTGAQRPTPRQESTATVASVPSWNDSPAVADRRVQQFQSPSVSQPSYTPPASPQPSQIHEPLTPAPAYTPSVTPPASPYSQNVVPENNLPVTQPKMASVPAEQAASVPVAQSRPVVLMPVEVASAPSPAPAVSSGALSTEPQPAQTRAASSPKQNTSTSTPIRAGIAVGSASGDSSRIENAVRVAADIPNAKDAIEAASGAVGESVSRRGSPSVVLPSAPPIQNLQRASALPEPSPIVSGTKSIDDTVRPTKFASLFGDESAAQVRNVKRGGVKDIERVESIFPSTVRISDMITSVARDLFGMEKSGVNYQGKIKVANTDKITTQVLPPEVLYLQGTNFDNAAQMCKKVVSTKRQLQDAVYGDRQENDGTSFEDVVSIWNKIRAAEGILCWDNVEDLLSEYFDSDNEFANMHFSAVYDTALNFLIQSEEED